MGVTGKNNKFWLLWDLHRIYSWNGWNQTKYDNYIYSAAWNMERFHLVFVCVWNTNLFNTVGEVCVEAACLNIVSKTQNAKLFCKITNFLIFSPSANFRFTQVTSRVMLITQMGRDGYRCRQSVRTSTALDTGAVTV